MAGLGIKVYLDENIDLRVAGGLRLRGYDAVHAYEEGNNQTPDDQHLRYATTQGRAAVSNNFTDFARHHADFLQRGEQHEGVILIPVRPVGEMIRRLSTHLNTHSPAKQRDNLLWA